MIACRTPIVTTHRTVMAAMTTSTRLLRASSRHCAGSISFAAAYTMTAPRTADGRYSMGAGEEQQDDGDRPGGGEPADLARGAHVVVDRGARPARPDRDALGDAGRDLGDAEREQLLVGVDDLVVAGGEGAGREDRVGERDEEHGQGGDDERAEVRA